MTPATTAAPDEPRPRPSGMGFLMCTWVSQGKLRWSWHRSTYRATRVSRLDCGSRLISPPSSPSPSYVMRQLSGCDDCVLLRSMLTCSSRYMDSASPMTSKPGPMLALEQGVLMTKDSVEAMVVVV